jgi:hypothetical protein
MLSSLFSALRLIGAAAVAAGLFGAVRLAMDANLPTTLFVLGLCLTPAIVMVLLANSAPAPSVVQILHALHTKDGRS